MKTQKEEIMRLRTKFFLILSLGLCLSINLAAQKPADMVGTWVGMATLEGMDEPDEFTLVLEIEGESLKGHLTDQYGTLDEAPLEEIKLEDGKFSFSVKGTAPDGQEFTMVLDMDVEGDSMKGTLEIPGFGTGAWEATKQK
jgi:hypothetical protein